MQHLLSRAHKIDQQRSEFLAKQQADINKLAQWHRDMNEIRNLMERDLDNLPSDFDQKKMELVLFMFKK